MRAKIRLIFLILIAIPGLAMAQDQPLFRCISLDANGDVTLTWTQPIDTGADFNSYIIRYRSGASGPFNVILNTPSYLQTTATIPGSFTGDARFLIQQVYNGLVDTSAVGDTIRPNVLSVGAVGKNVILLWNHSGLASPDSIYRVFKKDTSGAWQQIGTRRHPKQTFRDSISQCKDEVEYRLEYRGIGGCISNSNPVSRVVEDKLPPKITNLVCASVDTATGHVNLEWTPSASRDTYGYLVFYFEDFNRTDTVFGRNTNVLTYSKDDINALIRPETLSVAPFDSCYDSLNNWYNQAADSLRFSTLFIDTIGFDRCAGTLGLTWSLPKEGAVGVRNLSGFNVYRKINDGPSQRVARLSEMDSVFIDSGLVTGNKYNYVVTAVDGVFDKEAFSNPITFDLNKLNAPEFMYISSVRNDHDAGHNVVSLRTDSLSESVEYGLWRSLYPDQDFLEVERVDAGSKGSYQIMDASDRSGQTAYYYFIEAYDLCGELLATSQTVKSIYIDGYKNLRDLVNTVYWDEYQGYEAAGSAVASYELVRLTSDGSEEDLPSMSGAFEYVDDITEPEIINGSICYYVKAIEDSGNSYGLSETSISNLLCFSYPPKVFIPNAFSPDADGINDIFQPYVNYVDPTDYLIEVFDRMGRLVYRSQDPLQGWNGEAQPNGVYSYRLRLRNARDESVEYTGRVHLLR